MKKYILLLFSLPFALFIMPGCKHDKCNAGSGGQVTLVLKPQHHGIPVTGLANYCDSAFIKFNVTDFPGPSPSNYDMIIKGNPGEDFVKVPGLSCGQYYVFIAAFDTSIKWNIRVVGGIPINFSETSGDQTVIVPVTE